MYVPLGLLMIFLASVHGKMVQCFVGGIIKPATGNDEKSQLEFIKKREEYCDRLEKESVLQKCYIDHFGSPVMKYKRPEMHTIKSQIDPNKFDVPFTSFDIEVSRAYSEMTNKSLSARNPQNTEFYGYQPLRLLNTEISIVDYWDNIVKMGTDMHRLKFHSLLVNKFINGHRFSNEECIVFLKSNYDAVGIYYFTNNMVIARRVANDGLKFVNLMKSEFYNYNEDTDEMEVKIWEILTYVIYVEINELGSPNNITFEENTLNELAEEFGKLIASGKEHPCSYIYLFRSTLLDKNQLISAGLYWDEVVDIINRAACDNHSDIKKYQMYTNLILSQYNSKFELIKGFASFNHLINALKLPVFTSEDRLLNYKVTLFAMKKISNCVHEYGWKSLQNDILCDLIKSTRQVDQDFNLILSKLIHMQMYLLTNDHFIDNFIGFNQLYEKKLHFIVKMAIDNVNLPPRWIKMVEATIARLNKIIIEEQYSDRKNKNENIMIANKWLAELHGVLCTDLTNKLKIRRHQNNLEKSLTLAMKIQKINKFKDEHLEFLLYKKNCKDNYPSYSWERHYKADGWIQKTPNRVGIIHGNSKIFQEYNCNGVSKFLYTKNPFIHRADVNILMFRQLMMEAENNSVLKYLKNAMSQWVVTSEDRVRNLQAHELYSMYFLWKNYKKNTHQEIDSEDNESQE